jgi:hypothetical protein
MLLLCKTDHSHTLGKNYEERASTCIWVIAFGYPSATEGLLYLHKQYALAEHAISVEKVDHAVAGLQTVEAEASPCGQVVVQAVIVHDFEPAVRGMVR